MRHPARISVRMVMASVLAAGVMPLATHAAGGTVSFTGGISAASYTRTLAPTAAGAAMQFQGARVERSSATVSLVNLDASSYALACAGMGKQQAATCHLPAGGGALALTASRTHPPAGPAKAVVMLAYD